MLFHFVTSSPETRKISNKVSYSVFSTSEFRVLSRLGLIWWSQLRKAGWWESSAPKSDPKVWPLSQYMELGLETMSLRPSSKFFSRVRYILPFWVAPTTFSLVGRGRNAVVANEKIWKIDGDTDLRCLCCNTSPSHILSRVEDAMWYRGASTGLNSGYQGSSFKPSSDSGIVLATSTSLDFWLLFLR